MKKVLAIAQDQQFAFLKNIRALIAKLETFQSAQNLMSGHEFNPEEQDLWEDFRRATDETNNSDYEQIVQDVLITSSSKIFDVKLGSALVERARNLTFQTLTFTNVPLHLTSSQLVDIISKVAQVESITGFKTSPGTWQVILKDKKDSKLVYRHFQGMQLMNTTKLRVFYGFAQYFQDFAAISQNRLVKASGLVKSTRNLVETVQKYTGPISFYTFNVSFNLNCNQRHAFMVFKDEKDAKRAVSTHWANLEPNLRGIRMSFSKRIPMNTAFITGFPKQATKEQIMAYFRNLSTSPESVFISEKGAIVRFLHENDVLKLVEIKNLAFQSIFVTVKPFVHSSLKYANS